MSRFVMGIEAVGSSMLTSDKMPNREPASNVFPEPGDFPIKIYETPNPAPAPVPEDEPAFVSCPVSMTKGA